MNNLYIVRFLCICGISPFLAFYGHAQTSEIDSIYSITIDSITYTSTKIYDQHTIGLDRKDFLAMPGAFEDPSRLLMKYPGISTPNDQANAFIYHGMPAHFYQWQWNGAEIVNPNHLANAGTISDISSINSGGVNALSGEIISRFDFRGAPQSEVRNAIAGVADLQTRSDQNYVKIGLIGIETGYLNQGEKWSVGGNMRYSFTGLLGDLGVDFGGETIGFQDGYLETRYQDSIHSFLLAGLYGSSYNRFTRSEEPTVIKEFQDITYEGNINLLQAQYQKLDGYPYTLSATWSTRTDDRENIGSINVNNVLYDLSSTFSSTIGKLSLGQEGTFHTWGWKLNQVYDYGTLIDQDRKSRWRLGFSIEKNINLGTYTDIDLTLNQDYYTDLSTWAITPQLQVKSRIHPLIQVGLQSGLNAQAMPVVLSSEAPVRVWSNAAFIKFNQGTWRIEGEVFYHDIYDLGTLSSSEVEGLNILNDIGVPVGSSLDINTQGSSYGTSVFLDKQVTDHLYLSSNGSLFRASYNNAGDEVLSQYNFGYTYNAQVGYKKENEHATFRVDLAYHQRGGTRAFPLIDASPVITRYDYAAGPTGELPIYYRLDIKLLYQRGRSTWSLDIQNVTNRLNAAYNFIELGIGETIQDQLGLLPVLSYKYGW